MEGAVEVMRQARRLLLRYPEVREVVSQVGRAEGTMEPMGFDRTQAVVMLRPVREWLAAPGTGQRRSVRDFTDDMAARLTQALPGIAWDLTADFRDEMQTAFTAGAGEGLLKIFGNDLEALEKLAEKVAGELRTYKGLSGVHAVHCLGLLKLEMRVDREKCKRWGLDPADVKRVIQTAMGGVRASQIVEGGRPLDVTLCWPARLRNSEQALLDIPVDVLGNESKDNKLNNPIAASPRLRLRDLVSPIGADGEPDPKGSFLRKGAAGIYREEGRRFLAIHFRLEGKDSTEVAAGIRKKLAAMFEAPYRAVWEFGR
jgi:cobalt-zinc-cadmium resistance protein CzcA